MCADVSEEAIQSLFRANRLCTRHFKDTSSNTKAGIGRHHFCTSYPFSKLAEFPRSELCTRSCVARVLMIGITDLVARLVGQRYSSSKMCVEISVRR